MFSIYVFLICIENYFFNLVFHVIYWLLFKTTFTAFSTHFIAFTVNIFCFFVNPVVLKTKGDNTKN